MGSAIYRSESVGKICRKGSIYGEGEKRSVAGYASDAGAQEPGAWADAWVGVTLHIEGISNQVLRG